MNSQSSVIDYLARHFSRADEVSIKRLLGYQEPFSFLAHPKRSILLMLAGYLCLLALIHLPGFIPIEWSISRSATLIKQSVMAALLGKLVWECIRLLEKQVRDSRKELGSPHYALMSLGLSVGLLIAGTQALNTMLICVFATMLAQRSIFFWKRSKLQAPSIIGALVFGVGLQCAFALEGVAFVIWQDFLNLANIPLAPSTLLEAILAGAVVPLPMSIAGGSYLAFDIFGWAGFFGAFAVFMAFLILQSLIKGNVQEPKASMFRSSLSIPFAVSGTVAFLFLIREFPASLNWNTTALFTGLLTLALSIRNWRLYALLSIGLVVGFVQVFAEYLSGGLLE